VLPGCNEIKGDCRLLQRLYREESALDHGILRAQKVFI